jgi:hypothetical protein
VIPGDADPALRRFEWDALLACTGTAVLALVVTGGRWDVGLGVLGGGLLIGISYVAVKGAADLVLAGVARRPDAGAEEGARGPALTAGRRALAAVKFFTRYALLAVAAYVMLTCFRLHPVGVLAGATAPFLAALMQIGRLSRARARRRHP